MRKLMPLNCKFSNCYIHKTRFSPFAEHESYCDNIFEFAQVLKNWSSVHNINYTTGNRRRYAKFIREIDEAFIQFDC